MSGFNWFSRSRLSSKLLLLMLLNIFVLLVLTGFLVSSFNHIKEASSRITDAHIGDLLHNSESSYVMSQVFSDIELLSRTFDNSTPRRRFS